MSKILEGTLISKDNRIATGEVLIVQKEMIDHVFKPLLSNEEFGSTHANYLITVMLEYQRSLCVRDLILDLELQRMWLHYIIEHKEFQYLQMIQQYAILPDTPEIALEFLNASHKGCRIASQLAIDMYYRMNMHTEAIKIILERNKVEDVINYVEKSNLKGIKAKEILEAVHRLPEKEKILYIEYFIKARVKVLCNV